jgi:hypothetical protein
MKYRHVPITAALAAAALFLPVTAPASSHMDAPLIVLDPAANTTDVYAFVAAGENGDTNNYLVVGLGVYPFEEPGIGPNIYNFDPNVLYQIHVCTTNKARGLAKDALNDVDAGRATLSYQFNFQTTYKDTATILLSYLGPVTNVGDANQNLVQTYSVTKVDHRDNRSTVIFETNSLVPPNNEGDATPFYNIGNAGTNMAKPGVTNSALLDSYTSQTIYTNSFSYLSFAGQRDDGFYADVLSIFDLLQLRNPGKDSQKGFNIHEMVLRIPMSELGSVRQTVGVYATTSRRQITVLRNGAPYSGTTLSNFDRMDRDPLSSVDPKAAPNSISGSWVQVARQGNPLFNEVLVALADKDVYSRTSPTIDSEVFAKYALNPAPAALFNDIYNGGVNIPNIESNRTDIEAVFIPDVIKVDLSTGPAHLANNGDTNYNSLGVFGGDTLTSQLTTNPVSGGWPNGRRYGDNVADIALAAILTSTNILAGPPSYGIFTTNVVSQGVLTNDAIYSSVFPYESTPHNGRNHLHDSP